MSFDEALNNKSAFVMDVVYGGPTLTFAKLNEDLKQLFYKEVTNSPFLYDELKEVDCDWNIMYERHAGNSFMSTPRVIAVAHADSDNIFDALIKVVDDYEVAMMSVQDFTSGLEGNVQYQMYSTVDCMQLHRYNYFYQQKVGKKIKLPEITSYDLSYGTGFGSLEEHAAMLDLDVNVDAIEHGHAFSLGNHKDRVTAVMMNRLKALARIALC